ncbi:hypothetical protein JW948_03815 [bacterium]|nr:hypothetical protein [bacterium]
MGNVHLEKAKKLFRNVSMSIIMLALLSVVSILQADEDLTGGMIFILVLCILIGMWLWKRPSFQSGMTAGFFFILLAFVDFSYAEDNFLMGIYGVFNLVIAAYCLYFCLNYRKLVEAASELPDEPETAPDNETPVHGANVTINWKGLWVAYDSGVQISLDGALLKSGPYTKDFSFQAKIDPGDHKVGVEYTRYSREFPVHIETGRQYTISLGQSRWTQKYRFDIQESAG